MVQLIPDGLEATVPLPAAPPLMERLNVFDWRSKLTTIATSPVTCRLQVSLVSGSGSQGPATVPSVAPAAGVMVNATLAPDLNAWLHFPETLPPALTVQLIPPRSDTTVPPAALPVPPLILTWYRLLIRTNSGSVE